MRYILLLSMVLFTTVFNCLGQNPASTPVPTPLEKNSVAREIKKESPKNPVRLSAPLLKTSDENQQIIVYLVANDNSELENSKYQLKIYYREKLWRDLFEGEDAQQASVSIDGKIIALSSSNSDVSSNKNQFVVEPNIRTQTLTFDISAEDINLFSQAKSLSIVWNKMNAEITSAGVTIMHKFILDESSH